MLAFLVWISSPCCPQTWTRPSPAPPPRRLEQTPLSSSLKFSFQTSRTLESPHSAVAGSRSRKGQGARPAGPPVLPARTPSSPDSLTTGWRRCSGCWETDEGRAISAKVKSWVLGRWLGSQTPRRMWQAPGREGFAQATHISCPGLPWRPRVA